MDASVQRISGCILGVDYPAPIVDDKVAVKAAKDRMYRLRQSSQAREEAEGVQARHGSRKSGLPPSGQRRKGVPKSASKRSPKVPSASLQQGDLFA